MFSKVTDNYDSLNHILTFGLDIFWRRMSSKEFTKNGVMIDLCCGTGELLLHLSESINTRSYLLGLDFTEGMLIKAKEKAYRSLFEKKSNNGCINSIDFILADASNLPFKDACINSMGTSFSFRNLVYRNPLGNTIIREILRVLFQKGRFIIVESSQPRMYLARRLFHVYLRKFVPLIGGLISRYKPGYKYLGLSAANFPSAENLGNMLEKNGFSRVTFKQLIFGIVAIHVCIK
jgi:demethylmenaquinone methyltransferase/2-methoxy-6-polyprenyl-1,4-benzoquinol methylase